MQLTSAEPPGLVGVLADPVVTAALPGPQSYKGCRILPETTDPNAATYRWNVGADLTLLGAPVVEVAFAATAPDSELNVRLWDVTTDGRQALVTRGTYRDTELGLARKARFAIAPQGYRWKRGHAVKLEITANDMPYRAPNNLGGVVAITSASLTLPTR
jgi:predicted acyl esterase